MRILRKSRACSTSQSDRTVSVAVEEFITRHENRRILETLNKVYTAAPDADEEALQEGIRRQQRQLLEGQW
jgi:arginyl-tRNA--protein-N-Asp/Glu arginylyltransferase